MLLAWMERHYPAAGATQRERFAALLELPDPELEGWLMRIGGVLPADLTGLPVPPGLRPAGMAPEPSRAHKV